MAWSASTLLLLCVFLALGSSSIAADLSALSVALYDASNDDVTDSMIEGGTYYLYGQFRGSALYGYNSWHIQWKLDGAQIQEISKNNRSGGGYWTGATIGLTVNSPPFIAPSGTHTLTFVVDNRGEVTESNEGNNTVSRTFTVSGANEAPTDIDISNSTVPENQPSGTAVGTLSTTDPDADNTFTYTLVSGAGSTDNGSFTISGSTLQTAASFNYEVKSSYSARIRTTDQGGLWYEEGVAVAIADVSEPPPEFESVTVGDTDVVLQWSSIANHSYTLYGSTNLPAGFSELLTDIPATPPMNTHTGTVNGVSAKFWQVTTEE